MRPVADSMLTTGTSTAPARRSTTEWSNTRAAINGVVALHDPGDVLDRLADVEADLLAARVDGMTTELDDGHLHRVTGAVRRLLEDQRDALAGERATERVDRALGEIEHRARARRPRDR